MTIDEAIEGLQGEVREAEYEGALKAVAYLKLGVEALIRTKFRREHLGLEGEPLYPGETEG